MANSWAKVRNFLDMVDVQDLHSQLPLSSRSSSFSSTSSDLHPSSNGANKWMVGENIPEQILSVIQPTAGSEKRRREIIEYIQTLIEDSFGIKVFPFGSVPLKTYLPHGDVDLTAVSPYDPSQGLAAEICNLLQNEEKNNRRIQVRDVLYVPAQVRVVKCTVDDIAVDISFNQTAGLCALCFLEQVDRFIGKDHLFKCSVILIKAWCYYESRILGGFHGLISSYALETLVLHVINHFHSSLHCPLAVLNKFLEYYSTFDWGKYCVAIDGLVSICSLPEIEVRLPQGCDELLLTNDFLRNSREAFSSFTGVIGSKRAAFPVKFLNILDPLRDDNNLGRSVSKGNFYRIKSALSYGNQKLGDVIILPPEEIRKGLENFFINTLEINGRGRRADVRTPMPAYGARSLETSSADGDSNDLLTGFLYGLWFQDYGMIYPVQPIRSASPPVWNNGWTEMGQNMHYDQNMHYSVDESPPSSIDSPTSCQLTNPASVEEKRKSRGTGTYIPHLEHFLQRDIDFERNGKDEGRREIKRADSLDCTPREANFSYESGNDHVFNFSVEDFPLLPGSNRIAIKISQCDSPKCELVKEILPSSDSLEFGCFKCSPPTSVSEPGKQDSDVSFVLESATGLTSAAEEEQESPSCKRNLVIPVQPLELRDEKEFPPLGLPAKPEIMLNKKEFPPLCLSLKLEKRGKCKKNFKEVHKGEKK
uniref:Polynucleotide adenylyltransferase n=1 Tax=Opuntia streptacantha TaxID=393608 RepID=A0A7C9E525_OPUST